MHKVFNKIITFLMVTMLVGTSFIPTVVYAGNSINIGSQANDDRVKFELANIFFCIGKKDEAIKLFENLINSKTVNILYVVNY